MATMGGDQIYLYQHVGSSQAGGAIGRLLPRRIDFENAPYVGLKMTFDYVPVPQAPPLSWAALAGTVTTQTSLQRVVGRLTVPGRARPLMDPPRDGGVEWAWHLLPEDIQTVEEIRGRDRRNALRFQIELEGIARAPDGVVGISGNGGVEIAASEWDELIVALGYQPQLPVVDLGPAVARAHPTWGDAVRRLTAARDHLARGETHAALRSCLSEMEAVSTRPYDKEAWKKRLRHLDDQKADGVALALAGHGSLLNKVGHHRSRDVDATGGHPAMQLDQWEAEIAVAATHLYLALAIRLVEVESSEA